MKLHTRVLLVVIAATMVIVTDVNRSAAGPILPQFPSLPPIAQQPFVQLNAVVRHRVFDGQGFTGNHFTSVAGAGSSTTTRINPFTLMPETITSGGFASSLAAGGMVPKAEISGTVFGFASASARARATYFFQVIPLNPQVQALGPIPVIVDANAEARFTTGSPFVGGSVLGVAAINNTILGTIELGVDQGVVTHLADTFGGLVSLPIQAFALNGVGLRITGGVEDHNLPTGTSGFSGFVDPIIYVDPDATFQHNGQTLRFVEHYGIAYSPGVEQWQASSTTPVPEPTSLLLFVVVIATFLIVAVLRHQMRKKAGGWGRSAAETPVRMRVPG